MPRPPASAAPHSLATRVFLMALIAAGLALRIVLMHRAGVIEHDGAYYAGLSIWFGRAQGL